MIRSVTTNDPEVTDDDREWANAWLALKADECPGCGQPKSDAWDHRHPSRYEDRFVQCKGCTAIQVAAENDSEAGRQRRGVYRWANRVI